MGKGYSYLWLMVRRNDFFPAGSAHADFAGLACSPLEAAGGLDRSCQSLMPPSMALLLAPRAIWLGRFCISLPLPPPRRTEAQISAARSGRATARADLLQRSSRRTR